jgi:hypothetical protein
MTYLALVAGIAVIIYLAFRSDGHLNTRIIIGLAIIILYSPALTFLVIWKKGLLGESKYLLLVAISLILTIVSCGLGGMIPPAYMTTRPRKTKMIAQTN